MTRDELIAKCLAAVDVQMSAYEAVKALADDDLLADPEQRRPVVLLRADDCDCTPPYADCPHGPEPVDALHLMRWLHAESEWWLSQYKHDVVLWRQRLTVAEEREQAAERRETLRQDERDALQARIDTLNETLDAAGRMMASDARDWSVSRSDVWLYALIVGWECEEQHEHDDDMCGGEGALREVAAQHGWSPDDVARIRRFRAALQGDLPTGEADRG